MTQWDEETLQEEIDEAIGDSIDMDWTSAIGARHVMGIPVIAAVPDMVQALRDADISLEEFCRDQHPDNVCCHTLRNIRAILQRIGGEV